MNSKKLKKIMFEKNITAVELAIASDVSLSSIYKILRGKNNYNSKLSTVKKIAKALNVSVNDLIISEKEKYWKMIFKHVKGEIEVIKIEIEDNVGIVTYYMPYSTYEHEFFFQADLDTDKVISAFCDAVNQEAENMIQTIRDCSKDLKNLF